MGRNLFGSPDFDGFQSRHFFSTTAHFSWRLDYAWEMTIAEIGPPNKSLNGATRGKSPRV